jgi:hypothetical protein
MTDLSTGTARQIDHLVLPTGSLEAARARLSRLGFQVAPVGIHPFGTSNACIYLADGTFLEPLARSDESHAKAAAADGNLFVVRDAAYRSQCGEDGFSAIAFGTEDAAADHAAFRHEGYSAGPMLEFSRDFVDASGRSDRASFLLAFAADPDAPDVFFFTCQRVATPNADRSGLERHPNGVQGLKTVVLAASEAERFERFIRATSRAAINRRSNNRICLSAANAAIELVDDAELVRQFGATCGQQRGLQARAIVFVVGNLRATRSWLESHDVDCEAKLRRLIVPPAPGQGAIFVFEELS